MSPFCPACGHAHFFELIDFGSLPVSGVFLSDPADTVTKRRLRFEFCNRCGLIRQPPIGSSVADYTHVSRPTARQLPHYAPEIIGRLRESVAQGDQLIIEVGANDGTFLNALAQAGFSRRLGIEPSQSLSTACEQSGHSMLTCHLDADSAIAIRARHGAAAAVLCRHTLEHVADPAALLRAMAFLLAEDAVLFIEVPDSSPVVNELRAFELWDEHLSYFSVSNLRRMLISCGLSAEHMSVVSQRDSRNIVCWAQKAKHAPCEEQHSDASTLLRHCHQFAERWDGYRRELQQCASRWSGPVIAMGASHPQSNFLHFSGIGHLVGGLIDEDPRKIGRWVALPQPTRVSHPEELNAQFGGTLLLTGFGYAEWTQEMRNRFAHSRVVLVDLFDDSGAARSNCATHARNWPIAL